MTHENVRSHHPIKEYVPQALQGAAHLIVAEDAPYNLGQHRTIPTLRLKHRSGGSPRQEPPQAAVALRSASLRLGVRHGICVAKMLDNVGLRYPHRASGTKAPRTLRPLPLRRFAVSATGGAHRCSTKYYLRFWLSSCRTSLAVSALRIMRYCLKFLAGQPAAVHGQGVAVHVSGGVRRQEDGRAAHIGRGAPAACRDAG